MSRPLVACVPNFSEGRRPEIIKAITDRIVSVAGVTLLDVDPGKATNRTVVTFVGEPEPVSEAAFRAVAKAAELIDMRQHHGEHPRFGATDVCPLIPVSGITMEQLVPYAHRLAERIGSELGIPVYCYEHAAKVAERRNLAEVRSGEYEGLAAKLTDSRWTPDYGPARFNAQSGATAVGARGFLVAYNVNLNTTSTRRANAVAFDVREKGRVTREGNPLTGSIVRDAKGEPRWSPGTLKAVKAIGWYIEEYGVAQISMNLTNLSVTSIHQAFDEVCRAAEARGLRVTGSELVGMVPLGAMLDAGRHYLAKQHRSAGVADAEIIRIAVKSLGLDDLGPFNPEEKIIEYAIAGQTGAKLVGRTVTAFVEETASESVAPGGGSVAALLGALGAALGTMVANLSSHRRGWDDRWQEFAEWAEKGKAHHAALLRLVDADTDAFNRVMLAMRMPKDTDGERTARDAAMLAATKEAIEVPLEVIRTAAASLEMIAAMAEHGIRNSASDAGVGALCAVAAVRGAFLNVRTNCAGLDDTAYVERVTAEGRRIETGVLERQEAILRAVDRRMRRD